MQLRKKFELVASRAIEALGKEAPAVFGVELFNTEIDGKLDVLLNEVAPRPHNTGRYTQDACAVSQFENHLRAVCGLPLGDTSLSVGAAASKFYLCNIFCLLRFYTNFLSNAVANVLGAKSGTHEDTI